MRPSIRTSHTLSALLALSTVTAYIGLANPNFSPFTPALAARDASPQPDPDPLAPPPNDIPAQLPRRQAVNGCGTNHHACADLNAPGLCCANNAQCTADNAGNVACCPFGALCTGILTTTAPPLGTQTTTLTGGGSTVTPAPPPATNPATATGVVPNTWYPFPILINTGSSFANPQACAAAYSSCAAYSAACSSVLTAQPGAVNPNFGVTIQFPGGGLTAVPAPTAGGGVPQQGFGLSPESAAGVCASLSSQGCPGSGATCTGQGGGGNAQPTVTGQVTNFIVVQPGSGGAEMMGVRKEGAVFALAVGVAAWVVGGLW